MDTHSRTLFSCSLILYLSGWVTTFDQPRLTVCQFLSQSALSGCVCFVLFVLCILYFERHAQAPESHRAGFHTRPHPRARQGRNGCRSRGLAAHARWPGEVSRAAIAVWHNLRGKDQDHTLLQVLCYTSYDPTHSAFAHLALRHYRSLSFRSLSFPSLPFSRAMLSDAELFCGMMCCGAFVLSAEMMLTWTLICC